MMGHVRRGQGRPEEALDVYDELARRRPNWSKPFVWKAWAYRESERPAEAEAEARRALEIDPQDGEARSLLEGLEREAS